MYDPTRWQQIKDTFRYWFCRHKHTEVRSVKAGSKGNLRELYKFRYCLDCQNQIYDKELE